MLSVRRQWKGICVCVCVCVCVREREINSRNRSHGDWSYISREVWSIWVTAEQKHEMAFHLVSFHFGTKLKNLESGV